MSRNIDRLSIEPLTDFLALRGGLEVALQDAGVIVYEEGGKYTPTAYYWRLHLWRCRKRGWINALKADDFTVGIFGVHPVLVWGNEWFEGMATDTYEEGRLTA